jgi:hypothetical protein
MCLFSPRNLLGGGRYIGEVNDISLTLSFLVRFMRCGAFSQELLSTVLKYL